MGNPGALNAVYMDQLIDVSDISPSNVLYDFSLTSSASQEDIPSSPIVTLPLLKSPRKRNGDKMGTIERFYFCNECGASFSNSSNLKSHLRIHTGERPYSCDVCGISFVQSSNLQAHKRTHTGERPFKCLECGKSFTRSSHLVGHRRIHTGELPYACALCSKSFASSTQLRKHTDKHNDSDSFVCAICDKSFAKSSSLEIHLRIHSGERPHVCEECTAAFRSKDDLNVHRKLHSGSVYPYACTICGKGFKIKLCCEKHIEKCSSLPQKNTSKRKYISSSFFDSSFFPGLKSKRGEYSREKCQSQVFQFDESHGVNGLCKMEMLEGSIEDGIENEVDEQMMVFTNEGGNSVLHVIPAEDTFSDFSSS
ncbi:UNVERIFIED_CONTAM: hypothetical protein GTU68_054771 [Idotea baltica]|nr:hypothetical protein [Idotea baltica]